MRSQRAKDRETEGRRARAQGHTAGGTPRRSQTPVASAEQGPEKRKGERSWRRVEPRQVDQLDGEGEG